jgi:hypothetical protein
VTRLGHRPLRTRLATFAAGACAASLLALPAVTTPAAATEPDPRPVPGWTMLDRLLPDGVPGLDVPTTARALPGAELRRPTNLARLVAYSAGARRTVRKGHTFVKRGLRAFGGYGHVGPVHHHRFTVTVISDQACAIFRHGRLRRVENGPCRPADRRASMTPLQDSAGLLLLAVGDVYDWAPRHQVVRMLLAAPDLRWTSNLVAPRMVTVRGVVDRDRDGLDDDGRVAFTANGRSVCAHLPLYANQSGRVTFGSCASQPPRSLNLPPERPRAVFRELVSFVDLGVLLSEAERPEVRARQAARLVNEIGLRPRTHAEPMADRVELRTRINGKRHFACYRVDPDWDPAVYSESGEPGTWRLGRCR